MYEKSIELLNKAVGDEMSAVQQYMYFHFHCDDQGYEGLSQLFKRTAIEEMGHVEALSERILFLKGDAVVKADHDVEPIQDVVEMVRKARGMEQSSIGDYNRWANECSANNDAMSKKVFEDLVADEERHFGNYDLELDRLTKFGDRYLALQSYGLPAGGAEAAAE